MRVYKCIVVTLKVNVLFVSNGTTHVLIASTGFVKILLTKKKKRSIIEKKSDTKLYKSDQCFA